jgi:hypothetical protein
VHFTPEQEAQLSRIGGHGGTDTERLVKDAALRLLELDARLRAAVREGIAQADREEFIEEEEMDVGIERMLRPACVSGQGPTLVAKNATRMGHPPAGWRLPQRLKARLFACTTDGLKPIPFKTSAGPSVRQT